MRTFDFANRLKALRQAAGLSPEDIAVRLEVNADDIAAWEKGECLPDLKTTYRLAGMLNVSMDDLLTALPAEKQIARIVITRGPCAGKTTAQGWIETNFTKLGYKVLFIPETATELINGGIFPSRNGPGSPGLNNVDFQYELIRLQMAKEEVFLEAAEKMPAAK